MLLTDQAAVRQVVEINQTLPEVLAKKDDGHPPFDGRLTQGEHFKKLVEGAEATGEENGRGRAFNEVELAQGEVVELKAELWADVRVGLRFPRELDAETDRAPTGVEGPPVGGFHDSGSPAGDDDVLVVAGLLIR